LDALVNRQEIKPNKVMELGQARLGGPDESRTGLLENEESVIIHTSSLIIGEVGEREKERKKKHSMREGEEMS